MRTKLETVAFDGLIHSPQIQGSNGHAVRIFFTLWFFPRPVEYFTWEFSGCEGNVNYARQLHRRGAAVAGEERTQRNQRAAEQGKNRDEIFPSAI